MITQEYLKECLTYNPHTGVLVWNNRPRHHFGSDRSWKRFNTAVAGRPAGNVMSVGYQMVGIDYKSHLAHRLIFLYMTGKFPDCQVDHINGDRTDNRWSNLRAVSHLENGKNVKRHVTNTSGFTGVMWYKRDSVWSACIYNAGKRIHLGYFKKKANAIAARKVAEMKYNFHKNHGRAA